MKRDPHSCFAIRQVIAGVSLNSPCNLKRLNPIIKPLNLLQVGKCFHGLDQKQLTCGVDETQGGWEEVFGFHGNDLHNKKVSYRQFQRWRARHRLRWELKIEKKLRTITQQLQHLLDCSRLKFRRLKLEDLAVTSQFPCPAIVSLVFGCRPTLLFWLLLCFGG